MCQSNNPARRQSGNGKREICMKDIRRRVKTKENLYETNKSKLEKRERGKKYLGWFYLKGRNSLQIRII